MVPVRFRLSKKPSAGVFAEGEKNFYHFFGGVYVEKVLCGPNSARSPSSKKWLRQFFETQKRTGWFRCAFRFIGW